MTAAGITLRQLMQVLQGEIAWMRLYTAQRWEEPIDCMDAQAIQDAVVTYGDRTVRSCMPGYRFVYVWLD